MTAVAQYNNIYIYVCVYNKNCGGNNSVTINNCLNNQ